MESVSLRCLYWRCYRSSVFKELLLCITVTLCVFPDVSGESSQSGAQFQGRPSEVWSQWQNQHHSQQAGEQHTHPNPSQTEVFQVTHMLRHTPAVFQSAFQQLAADQCTQICNMSERAVCPQHVPDLGPLPPVSLQDMLPMAGDPTQGTANYNIEDFADLGMFPPFSE